VVEYLHGKTKVAVRIHSHAGHIDGKSKYIGDYPDTVDILKWLPSVEPRSLAFYINEGREKEFLDAFLKTF
jgi:hypothetical protein